MIRWYIMPLTIFPDGEPIRGPKYLYTAGVNFGGQDFGRHDACIVWADVTAAQHTALAARTDVIAVPRGTVNAAQATIGRNILENHGIPAEWLVDGVTGDQIVRRLCRTAQFYQAVHGELNEKIVDTGEDPSTGVPLRLRQRLAAFVARRPGYQRLLDNIETVTVRQLVAAAHDAWGPAVVHCGGVDV